MKFFMFRLAGLLCCSAISITAMAALVTVTDQAGKPLTSAMVTQSLTHIMPPDISDHGYQAPGKPHVTPTLITAYTGSAGTVVIPDRTGEMQYRLRKPGYQDAVLIAPPPVRQCLM